MCLLNTILNLTPVRQFERTTILKLQDFTIKGSGITCFETGTVKLSPLKEYWSHFLLFVLYW